MIDAGDIKKFKKQIEVYKDCIKREGEYLEEEEKTLALYLYDLDYYSDLKLYRDRSDKSKNKDDYKNEIADARFGLEICMKGIQSIKEIITEYKDRIEFYTARISEGQVTDSV